MDIHVVQQGDSIYSIAEKYGVPVEKIIIDNGLEFSNNLVIGQTIVITYPAQTHIVQQGDTLQSIANTYDVTPMQILRNNPYLSDREYLFVGESLVISYNTTRSITTNGIVYPFIKRETLLKTLPSLTYMSVFNYTTIEKGEIVEYQDDTEIIKVAKDYGVIPLMMLTTLTPSGAANIETAYSILLNEEYQEETINNFIEIIKRKGYQGINIIFSYLNEENQLLYQSFVQRIYDRIQSEGFLFFITINFNMQIVETKLQLEQIDYGNLSRLANGLIFVKFKFGFDYGPPDPVTNLTNIRILIDYAATNTSLDKLSIGIQAIGYDWQLPYIPNKSSATSLSIDAVLRLADHVGTTIQFDDVSQTPYFYYNQFTFDYPFQHIVWFIDARTINAVNNLIIEYNLNGAGVWNIMIYNAQLWTIINANFDVIKLI
jgi:spore germination protein